MGCITRVHSIKCALFIQQLMTLYMCKKRGHVTAVMIMNQHQGDLRRGTHAGVGVASPR